MVMVSAASFPNSPLSIPGVSTFSQPTPLQQLYSRHLCVEIEITLDCESWFWLNRKPVCDPGMTHSVLICKALH